MGSNTSNDRKFRGSLKRISRQSSMFTRKPKNKAIPDSTESEDQPIYKNFTNVTVNKETMTKFLEVQSQIEEYDNQGVFEKLTATEEEFEIIEKNKQQAEIKFKLLSEQCKKEKQDFENISLPTVQCYFKNKKDHNKAISKEQHEYLQSLNLVEIAENELNSINQQYIHAKEKLSNYKTKHKIAIQLYNDQMKILYSTYQGDYGSAFENKLENEVTILGEQKEILRSALNKWRNASFLLIYAYNQILYSEQRWKEMMNEINSKYPERVISATEVRNNLVAAYQNLLNTKTYLKNVELPYCTETDLKTLQNLASRTYEDMLSTDRQRYCLSIIQILRKRCASLNQWFEQVITTILVVDYSEIKAEFDQKFKELKMERIRLLNERINENTGKKIDLSLFNLHLESIKELPNDTLNSSFIIGNDRNSHHTRSLHKLDFPLTDADLFPMPTKDQIFGNSQLIKLKYRQHIEEWNREVSNQPRMFLQKKNSV